MKSMAHMGHTLEERSSQTTVQKECSAFETRAPLRACDTEEETRVRNYLSLSRRTMKARGACLDQSGEWHTSA